MATKRKKSPMMRLRLWQAFSIFITFAPILFTIYIEREKYFATKAAGLSLTCGGIVAVVLVAVAMLGKGAKLFGSGVTVSGIIFLMAYLLEPILLNLQLLSGMLFMGFAINRVFVVPRVKQAERQVAAKMNAKALKEELHG